MTRTLATPPGFTGGAVVMGVSGCGKTTVGRELAGRVGALFVEGDDYHPAANRTKLAGGIPLTDEDRWPWLAAIGAGIAAGLNRGPVVAACSALKRRYRDQLVDSAGVPLSFICLHGDRDLLAIRLQARRGHFMSPTLLDSQIRTLELPAGSERAITLDIACPIPDLVEESLSFLVPPAKDSSQSSR
ncbi:MAG TPA: gluconokinase [Aestuariivirgaceae bacterium]|nr:gluconokinase [Aestuariivirgaceae bacterium]